MQIERNMKRKKGKEKERKENEAQLNIEKRNETIPEKRGFD